MKRPDSLKDEDEVYLRLGAAWTGPVRAKFANWSDAEEWSLFAAGLPHGLGPDEMVEVQLDGGPRWIGPECADQWSWAGADGLGVVTAWRRVVPLAAEGKPTNPKDAIGVRKAPFSTVPMNVIAEVGVAMLEGAAKYGRHNYRGVGVRASVYFDATMRHLVDYWECVDVDPDSGMHHITKAIASLVVLRDAQMQGLCEDDRPPVSAPFLPALNDAAGTLLDKHAEKSPHHYTRKP